MTPPNIVLARLPLPELVALANTFDKRCLASTGHTVLCRRPRTDLARGVAGAGEHITGVPRPVPIADAVAISVSMRVFDTLRTVAWAFAVANRGDGTIAEDITVADIGLAVFTRPPAQTLTVPVRGSVRIPYAFNTVLITRPAKAALADTVTLTTPDRAVVAGPVGVADAAAVDDHRIAAALQAVGIVRTSTSVAARVTSPAPVLTKRTMPIVITHTEPCLTIAMSIIDALITSRGTGNADIVLTPAVALAGVGLAVRLVPAWLADTFTIVVPVGVSDARQTVVWCAVDTSVAAGMTLSRPQPAVGASPVGLAFTLERSEISCGVLAAAVTLAW
jgi:hypothetical protein